MKRKFPLILVLLIAITSSAIYATKVKELKDITSKKQSNQIVLDGIFKKYGTAANKIVSKMTIEEKVGQLFLVRYSKNDVEYLSNFYPGGYILFAKDFDNHTKEEMKKELETVQNQNKYPLILGVDEEGG